MHMTKPTRRTGFTLVEILIVVVILGILAALVVPQFTSAGEQTRENSVKMDLFRIRQQIEIYKQQHGDLPSLAHFAEQMTKATNSAGVVGEVGEEGFLLGPYLRDIPRNPYTDTRDVADFAEEPGDSAWAYDEVDGIFVANSTEAHREW